MCIGFKLKFVLYMALIRLQTIHPSYGGTAIMSGFASHDTDDSVLPYSVSFESIQSKIVTLVINQ